MNDTKPKIDHLKIQVNDPEDLELFSSIIQDSLVSIKDISYFPEEHRFILILNRFCWEKINDPFSNFERTLSALILNNVVSVQTQNINFTKNYCLLNLLSLSLNHDHELLLTFSGKATIKIHIQKLSCYLDDFGQTWPAWTIPVHY
ncbi:MAG: DUF2948 family protein [Alphaproteobacteria bacterium]|nr:DUF2948 family protein [Alphaproteobacteria bacterium]